MGPEQPARGAPADGGDAAGGPAQARLEVFRLHDHQPARAAVESDRVALVGDALHNRRRLRRDVLVDQEERRAYIMVPKGIKERRRPVRIRAVVEGEKDGRGRPGLRCNLPQRPGRPEGFEQEWEGSGMRQRGSATDHGDDDGGHARSYQNR
jgi:hypothetical protein